MFQERLVTRWATDWEKLLDSRRSLLHWKEDLKSAEENYERTKVEGYLDDIEEDQYAIRELEAKINVFKEKLEAKTYDPYEVLEVAWNASGQEIYESYRRLYHLLETICSAWAENL